MLNIEYQKDFLKKIAKIKNKSIKQQVKNQVKKVLDNPLIEKPMRYNRKDTRELYVKPFRLAYKYQQKESTIIFLDLYHKDKQ